MTLAATALIVGLVLAYLRVLALERRRELRRSRVADMRRARVREDVAWRTRDIELRLLAEWEAARYALACTCGDRGVCTLCVIADLERPHVGAAL